MVNSLAKYSRQFHIAAGLITVMILGLVDYVTGPTTFLSFFYLIPIVQVTWFGGPIAGIVTALSSAIIWLLGELAASWVKSYPLAPVWNIVLIVFFFLAVSVGLAAFRDRLKHASEAATADPLTGVVNARRFREVTQVERDRALRYRHPLTLAYVEVDDYPEVHQQLGRPAEKALLRAMAVTIGESIRSSDLVGRLDSAAFGILLVEADPDQAQAVIIRTRQKLLETMRGNGWPVTFSFGVIAFLHPLSSVDEMIRMVEALVHLAEGEGKDSVKFEVYSD